jgi:hypothetical protein
MILKSRIFWITLRVLCSHDNLVRICHSLFYLDTSNHIGKVYIPKMCILEEHPHSIAMRYVQSSGDQFTRLSSADAPVSEGPNRTLSSVSVDCTTSQPGSYYSYGPHEAISPRVLHAPSQSQGPHYPSDNQDELLLAMMPGQNIRELDDPATSPVSLSVGRAVDLEREVCFTLFSVDTSLI